MSTQSSPGKSERRSRITGFALRNWLALGLAVVAVAFIAQIRERVPFHVFWLTVTSPLWLLMTALFLAGWLVGMLIGRR